LPSGPDRPVREREIDLTEIRADLAFDMAKEEIAGTLLARFVPLRPGTWEVSFDAAGLEVSSVESVEPAGAAPHSLEGRELRVRLPQALAAGQAGAIRITYRATRPLTGLYFQPATGGLAAQAWSYGEGGLHYGWLPLYNDTNDRFAVTLALTVPRGAVALANGRLESARENPDGTKTFLWVQPEPIPNYLLAVDVGDFRPVDLGTVAVARGPVPLTVWTAPGSEEKAKRAFGVTPRMLEFYSKRFGYDFPWPKYDQVVLRNFAGAMETATMVGFEEKHLQGSGDPAPDDVYASWTVEDIISHELAHHWFGDLVTCRSLASIWLNESFATFAHLLWNEHAHGADDFAYRRWNYLDRYLAHVRETGEVRPLEYFRYESPEAMYGRETTYYKGALVLHLLRHVLGDDAFFRGVAGYLRRHAFGEVEARDLQAALEAASGRNLAFFFEDWIVRGGGHPALRVSHHYSPERRQVDLTVKQVQADLPFENDFRLPEVEVEVITGSGATAHRVELAGWTTQVSLPASSEPRAVIFDKGGWLVAEVDQARSFEETLFVATRGGISERLRAIRDLGRRFGQRPEAVDAIARTAEDGAAHWGVRIEAALGLASLGNGTAAAALVRTLGDPDLRIRRAAAVALGRTAHDPRAVAALRRVAEGDRAEEVAASALASLGRIDPRGSRGYLLKQIARESRWWDAIRKGALRGLDEARDPALASTYEGFTDPRYDRSLRGAALDAWARAAPGDPRLARRLRELASDRVQSLRAAAVRLLGSLHRREDLSLLEELAKHPDPNLAATARDAIEEIGAFAKQAAP
jgi:aminopeptidase N